MAKTDPNDMSESSGAGAQDAVPPVAKPVRLRFLGREVALPRSRLARTALGVGLMLLGTLGFLPVLGFWMIPLGVLILSYDFAAFRRLRRRIVLWWGQRRSQRARNRG